jgi:hypothetical protein
LTGVAASPDYRGTLDAALSLHLDIEEVIIVAPGKINVEPYKKLISTYETQVRFTFVTHRYASDIDKSLLSIGKDTILIPIAMIDNWFEFNLKTIGNYALSPGNWSI